MADPVIDSPSGLQLSNNTFSASPPGAMSVADNCVISQKGVVEPRNGQERAGILPLNADLPFALTEFQQKMLCQFGLSKTDASQGLGYLSGGSFTPYSGGPYNPVGANGSATDYARMKFMLASLFLYFSCANGPRVLESFNGTPRRSGLSRVPDIEAGQLITPTGTQVGVVPYNSSVAYRTTHKRITSTGQVLTSPPSNRFVVTNRFRIPAGGLVRTGGNLVTVTITPGQIWAVLGFALPFTTGNTIAIEPNPTGDANFVAGTKVLTGAPSTNTVTYAEAGANVASTVDVELDPGALYTKIYVRLPLDAIAGDVIQLWKSVATSDSSIEPSDDVYLCAEHLVTSANVAAGSFTISDFTPESVLQVPLYTNPSDGDGQGEPGQNFQPPIYLDAASFDSRAFYLSTTGQQYLDLQMLGVGGPDGVQDGDTLTVFDGVATTTVFTFKNSPGAFTDIPLISDGTPGYNIAWTTYFLAVRVNFATQPLGIRATGATSPNGFPGAWRLERTDYLQTAFQVKASRPSSWSPALQSATYTNSFGNAQPNGLVWSKAAEPEAVPVVNAISAAGVGVPNYYGRRCFGLRNALVILKEGDGIWTLTGTEGNYSLTQISNANTIAPDCACVFSDCVWAYTDQGILRISDTGGVQTVSRPIETELNRLAALYPTQTYAWSFAVGYETERRVMFWVPVGVSPSNPNLPLLEAWCYSAATNAWTRFNHRCTSAVVSTGHQLWTGIYDETFAVGRLTSERKTGTYLDVADAVWNSSLTTTSDPLVVGLNSEGAVLQPIQKGSGVSQIVGGVTYYTKVAAVLGGGLYQLAEVMPWENNTCSIYDPYLVEAKFLPRGDPGGRKNLSRLLTLYKPSSFTNYYGQTVLETDQMQAELAIDSPSLGYGLTAYGGGPYGNPSPMVVDANPIDAKWAAAAQFFPGFRLNEVWFQMKLQGVGMQVEGATAPVGRGR